MKYKYKEEMTAVITTVVSIFAALWILLLIKKDIDKYE